MPNYLWSYLNLMSTVRETAVGLFVLFGLVCVAYLTIKLGKMEVFSQQGLNFLPTLILFPACGSERILKWPGCRWAAW